MACSLFNRKLTFQEKCTDNKHLPPGTLRYLVNYGKKRPDSFATIKIYVNMYFPEADVEIRPKCTSVCFCLPVILCETLISTVSKAQKGYQGRARINQVKIPQGAKCVTV